MISRRTLLKAAPVAAVAPMALTDAAAMPSRPLPLSRSLSRKVSDYAVLLVPRSGRPVWGPDPFLIEHLSDGVQRGVRVEFEPHDCERTEEFIGIHLIHRPTRTKYELMEFRFPVHVCTGDYFQVSVNKVF